MTSRVPPPSPPYEGPAAHTSKGDNMPIRRIVIHSAVVPCKPGQRHAIARWFRDPDSQGSAHYATDPVGACQIVGDHTIAWHAPPNPHSLGIEMADTPGPVPGDGRVPALVKAARRTWRWRNPNQQAMLHVTAQLTAQAALAYGVPIRWLSVADLRAGREGITSHANVSQAFHQSTHWDPGFWPRRRFMDLVRGYARQLRQEHDS